MSLLSYFNGKTEHMVTPVVYSTANHVEHKCVSFAENPQPSKQVLNTPLSLILSGEQREKSAHFSLAACHGSKFNLPSSPPRFHDAEMVSRE